MARIYDNIDTKFTQGLQGIISNVGVRRVDFCVGYFNLRGWNLIMNQIDPLMGNFVNAVKIEANHLSNDKRGETTFGDVVGLGWVVSVCAIVKMCLNQIVPNIILSPIIKEGRRWHVSRILFVILWQKKETKMNLGQVYTKRRVADFMTGLFTIHSGASVLDPCLGRGVFVRSLLDNTDYRITGVEIDADSFAKFENPNLGRCLLKQGDFFDVEDESDGIIMNPPYVRQEEIDQLAPLGVTKQKLQSACGLMAISTKANLYMYFILRAIMLLREGGELIAIFPNSWTNTPLGRQFREQMLHHGSITRFIDVEGEAFEGSPMVDVCIMKFVKGTMPLKRDRIRTKYGRLTIANHETLTFKQDEYRRIAEELCDGLPNNRLYVAKRLKEIQEKYNLTKESLDDLCWEDSSSMFNEIYCGYSDFGERCIIA